MKSIGNFIIKRNHNSGESNKAGDLQLWQIYPESETNIGLYTQYTSPVDSRCLMTFIGEFPLENWEMNIEWFFYYQLRADIIENDAGIVCQECCEWFRGSRRKEINDILWKEGEQQ